MQRSGGGEVLGEININSRRPLIRVVGYPQSRGVAVRAEMRGEVRQQMVTPRVGYAFGLLVIFGGSFVAAAQPALLSPPAEMQPVDLPQQVLREPEVVRSALPPELPAEPVPQAVPGEVPLAKPEPPALTVEVIASRREQVTAASELDESAAKRALELLDQAEELLLRATELAVQAETYRQRTETVPERLEQTQQRIEELRLAPPIDPGAGLDLPALELELAQADRQLAEVKQNQAAADARFAARADRRREVRNLLFSTPQRLQEIDRQLESPPLRDEPAELSLARRTELRARRMLIEQEIPALQNELAMYDAEDRVDLLRFKRDMRIQEVALAEQRFRQLDERARQLRLLAADQAVREADEEVFRTLPLLRSVAEQNVELAAEAQRITRLVSLTNQELQEVQASLEEVQRLFTQARDLVDRIGLTRTVGAQLRKQRSELPTVRERYQNLRQRQETIEEVHFELFRLDQERNELAQQDVLVADIVRRAPSGLDETERQRLREAAEELLDRQRQYLDTLIRNQDGYFDALTSLDTAEQQLVQMTEEYVAYINERVLWIRSTQPLTSDWRLSETDWWIVSPARWTEVAAALGHDARRHPNLTVAALVLLAVLIVLRWRARKRIAELGELAQRRNCTQFRLTLKATAYTLVLSLLGTAISWYLAWRLIDIPGTHDFVRAVAIGLWVVGWAILPVEVIRHICRPQGLAESHFDWAESALHSLRTHLTGWTLLVAPLVFVSTTLYAADPEQGYDVLERLLFCLLCGLTSFLLSRILRPVGGVLHEYIAFNRDGWLDRTRYLLYILAIALPLGPAALAFFGYSYTAQHLTIRLFSTASLFMLLIIIRSFLLRLLLVHRRHLSMRQARERRAAALAALQSDSAGGSPSRSMVSVDESVDLAELSSQTQRIVTTGVVVAALLGVWAIWDGAIPALRMLDRPLYPTVVTVSDTVMEDGVEYTTPREEIRPVRLSNLFLAGLIAITTVIAFRNLPGLLEIAVLQRLPLEASMRYATTALCSYAIVMVGVVIASGTLGLRWSQIQWLATALTFGLAFGLQEIFANFVAGLIILFERPIRVGDVVTVDNVSGVVSRMRIRATTIVDWDRKEFVVPNKEFITGRLLNWTLSDNVNRVVIEVGVAYGSDTERVRSLLLQAGQEHPQILENPAPMAIFDGFGDSALKFSLRVFLPSLDCRLAIVHDLHTKINQLLGDAGIVIPFPQRDLHVRSIDPPIPTELVNR